MPSEPTTHLKFNYPQELPICEHRIEILEAIRNHPVVIVCGDTGSGKTTQLPKMALELGRANRGRRIAITQPRRLAAVTMAERVATELHTGLGEIVGFRHRFGRKISSATRIEFMTDGILLAETRFDSLLRAYDTIIVDEAHERSLNIDFLLGILKRILTRRHDLKVIVASATLDTVRFSDFFDHAPTISVPGRLFPINVTYRPPPEDSEADLPRDIALAVAEFSPDDDILVFLPGERDIRETADHLQKIRGSDDIIPLLSSLPAAEQRRAFQPSSHRRIILSTNVAETSVTIPGIRAVIDSGLTRISRYSHRTQVQRLQIEPISQASAKQRTGRCGRIGPGNCIRLYSLEDFNSRDAYTPPEVLRSSLAGVMLTMLDLHLGNIERFPFIDPPKPAMIHDGLRELLELGAIRRAAEGGAELTDIGRKLAKIPVDPRLARMLLAASKNATLPSVLPLVAAMACDDPRRRPIDERERADQLHARFHVAGSDFLGTLKLWHWWEDETKDLSQSKARKLCKEAYLSFPKMREWSDLTKQLASLCQRLGLDVQNDNGGEAMLHRSLLAGLLGRIGKYDPEKHEYRGAHALRFVLHPSSILNKKSKQNRQPINGNGLRRTSVADCHPQWIVAGELVETTRLFARNAAIIDVRWLESVAGSICKHSYHSPEWDPQSGFVRATEQITLYGLVIVPARRCDYSHIDPIFSREIFIRRGLVYGEFPRPTHPIRENQIFLEFLRKHAEKFRHPEFFNSEKLEHFFDQAIPRDIASADALRKWLNCASPAELDRFRLKKSEWWPKESASDRDFPNAICIAGAKLSLSYRHSPNDPECDGITCSVRKRDAAVLRLWRADWLVPGMLAEKISWMLSVLPTSLRRVLSPISDSVAILLPMLKPGSESLEATLRRTVYERWAFQIPENAWQRIRVPPHLQMRFCIRDDASGKPLAISRNLEEALNTAGVAQSLSAQNDATSSVPATTWVFNDIPEKSCDRNSGWLTEHYPALHDEGNGVTLRIYTNATDAAAAHETAIERLYVLALAKKAILPFRRRQIPLNAALYLDDINYSDGAVASDILAGAIAETMVRNLPSVRTKTEFNHRLESSHANLVQAQSEITVILIESAAEAYRLTGLLANNRIAQATAESISEQLAWLVYPGFPKYVPLQTLRNYRRYLKGIAIRIERARLGQTSDQAKELRFSPYWVKYREAAKPTEIGRFNRHELAVYRWMVEEFRISVFAQELHTPEPVSPKRLDAQWALAVGKK